MSATYQCCENIKQQTNHFYEVLLQEKGYGAMKFVKEFPKVARTTAIKLK